MSFLNEKAILFEKKSKSRTYIILDVDELEKGYFKIVGYFTIALKVLKIPLKLSKTKTKKIDGVYKNIETIPTYLIGQLAKNDEYKSKISGSVILEYAELIIKESFKIVGGRIILIESTRDKKLIEFYEKEDYKLLIDDENDELIQWIKFLV